MKRGQLDFAINNVAFSEKNANEMEVNCLLMYSGNFVDAGGADITVKPELLRSLASRYMNYLETPLPGDSAIRKFFGKAPERLYRPISLNHSKDNVLNIIGRVIGLEVKEDTDDAFLFGKMKILGEDNVQRVRDGRLNNVSISFDYDDMTDMGDLIEISYVFDGAVEGARSFGKPVETNTVDFNRVEMGKIAIQLKEKEKSIKQLDIKLGRLYNMKKTYDGLQQFVKEGLISRADMKRLSYDVSQIDLSKYQVYLRAIKTVALSRKHIRGRVSNNMQMTAFSSFMDSLVENGGKMEKGIDVGTFVKNVTSSLNGISNKTEVNASGYTAESHIDGISDAPANPNKDDYKVTFSVEDLQRLGSMVYEDKREDALAFMGECAGMEFKFGDSEKEEAEEDDKEESKAEANPESRDYSKSMDETIKNLSKQIQEALSLKEEDRKAVTNLTEMLVKLSTKQPEEK